MQPFTHTFYLSLFPSLAFLSPMPIGNCLFRSELSGHSFPHPSAVNGPVLYGAGETSLSRPASQLPLSHTEKLI